MTRLSVVSAGCDYLTLTSTNHHTIRRMGNFFDRVAADDKALGYERKKAYLLGFYGYRTRHAFYGEHEGRWMYQVSGAAAQPAVLLVDEEDNCTRIDLQVTVRLPPGNVQKWLDAAEAIADAAQAGRGVRAEVSAIHKRHGNETVYIGKPASDVRIRLYDKFAESKKEEYKECVRLEVQLRNRVSKTIWKQLARAEHPMATSIGMLCYLLNRRGISTDWIDLPWSYVRPVSVERTKEEATVGWWDTQVAPSIRRISGERGLWLSLYTLYGGYLTESELKAILEAAAQTWGN